MPASVRHVLTVLAFDDLPRAVAFYRAAFAWEVAVEAPVYVELTLPGGMRLGLYQREAFGRNTGQAPSPASPGALSTAELYLQADDLGAAVTALEAAGARRLSPAAWRDWGDEVAYYADPEGHVLALARLRPARRLSSPGPGTPPAARRTPRGRRASTSG